MEAPAALHRAWRSTFHGARYILTVMSSPAAGLTVEAERDDTSERWIGTFGAAFVEEITAKTGNFKKYEVFVKMLVGALDGSSTTVAVDLLTYADLEALRARKSGAPAPPPPPGAAGATEGPRSKRYVILTYHAEFDRVHYPLPLSHMGEPSPEALQRTVTRLRSELALAREGAPPPPPLPEAGGGGGGAAAALRAENGELRARLVEALDALAAAADKENGSGAPPSRKLRRQHDALKERCAETQEAYVTALCAAIHRAAAAAAATTTPLPPPPLPPS